MLDPFGAIGSILSVAFDGIGRIFGREPKKQKGAPREQILSDALYLFLLVGGVTVLILVVYELYFERCAAMMPSATLEPPPTAP